MIYIGGSGGLRNGRQDNGSCHGLRVKDLGSEGFMKWLNEWDDWCYSMACRALTLKVGTMQGIHGLSWGYIRVMYKDAWGCRRFIVLG